MVLQAFGDRVIIEVLSAAAQTEFGILLPESAQEKPQQGRVVSIGSDELAQTLREGDIILFSKYAGTEVNFEGKDYLIVKSDGILAYVVDDSEIDNMIDEDDIEEMKHLLGKFNGKH